MRTAIDANALATVRMVAKNSAFGGGSDRLAGTGGAVLVYGMIFSAVVLQLFAVPGAGAFGLGLAVGLLLVAWATLAGYLRVDPLRLCAYMLALTALMATLTMKWAPFSVFSFLMLATIYLPFIVVAATDRIGYLLVLDAYQRVAIFAAVCGIGQFAIQFMLGTAWMFPFQLVLPDSFFIPFYNLRIPITDGVDYLKSTGIWFLEPSLFSQALAFALLIEILYFRRLGVLLLFGFAYITSFSGTGALLLAAVAIPLLIRMRQLWPLVGVVALLIALLALKDVPPFSFFVARLGEFGHPLSSASMRFFAPYWLTRDVILADPLILCFGLGPGATDNAFLLPDYAVQDTFWLKLLLEYGLFGAVPFMGFYLFVLFHRSPDKLLSFAFLFQSMVLGGYLNSYFVQFLMLVLVGWPRLIGVNEVHNARETCS